MLLNLYEGLNGTTVIVQNLCINTLELSINTLELSMYPGIEKNILDCSKNKLRKHILKNISK